jgi:hypothetical protein
MAETWSDREVGQDNKLHLRRKYTYTRKYVNATGCLNTVLHIHLFDQVVSSNLSPDTGWFSSFPQAFQANPGIIPRLGYDLYLPNFSIHRPSYHLMPHIPDTARAVVQTTKIIYKLLGAILFLYTFCRSSPNFFSTENCVKGKAVPVTGRRGP